MAPCSSRHNFPDAPVSDPDSERVLLPRLNNQETPINKGGTIRYRGGGAGVLLFHKGDGRLYFFHLRIGCILWSPGGAMRKIITLICAHGLLSRAHGLLNRAHELVIRAHGLVTRAHGLVIRAHGLA